MQYVICKFRLNDARAYTYHNKGEPVKVGDRVMVDARGQDGWIGVHVIGLADAKPPYETKPIHGLAQQPKE